MLTKILGKGIPFLGILYGLNLMYYPSFQMEGVPASGPLARDGMITVYPEFGKPPYRFCWEGPASFKASTPHIAQLAPGTYCVTVTDVRGKSHVRCKYLSYLCPEVPFGLAIKQPIPGEANGSLELKLPQRSNNYYSWCWNTGDTCRILKNLSAGYYQLTIKDSVGCSYFPGIHLFEEDTKEANLENLFNQPLSKKNEEEVVHSEVRSAELFGAVRELTLTALYSNCSTKQFVINLESPFASWITIVLHDSYYRPVLKDLRFVHPGNNMLKIEFPESLPSGVYIINLTNNEGMVQYKKLIHLPQRTLP